MLFGLFVAPTSAEAGFFSAIFGTKASAEEANAEAVPNSQNMPLLEANVSSATIIDEKKSKTEPEIKEDAQVNITSDNALLPATGPLGVSDGTDSELSTEDIEVYVVRQGDSLSAIADMFGVSVNTILWANDMKKGDKPKVGEVLLVMPINGAKHTVAKGQTIASIAKLYKGDTEEIARFNGIAENEKLAVGEEIFIPDGQMVHNEAKPASSSSKPQKGQTYSGSSNGYFIHPLPGSRISQRLHDNYGYDYAAKTGTPIYAAAAGKVAFARTGYNGGYGNLVIIDHANGTKTYYAHQSRIAVSQGAQVAQGQVIGYVGSTGRSTGPHLHFEVRNMRHPGIDNSYKSWNY